MAEFLHYLCSEWGYPGIEAAKLASADEVIPIVAIYEAGQEKSAGTPVTPAVTDWGNAPVEAFAPEELVGTEAS